MQRPEIRQTGAAKPRLAIRLNQPARQGWKIAANWTMRRLPSIPTAGGRDDYALLPVTHSRAPRAHCASGFRIDASLRH